MKKLNTKQTLEAVAQVFTDHPNIYTRRTFARDKAGRETDLTGNKACKFCVSGLLRRMVVENLITVETRCAAVYAMERALIEDSQIIKSIVTLNDVHGRAAVVKIARRAAAAPLPILPLTVRQNLGLVP